MNKPTHVKPSYYSYVYHALKEIAFHFGYNLVLHGSMNRDLDLIAIPWIDEPKPSDDMIYALIKYLGGEILLHGAKQRTHNYLPGGRKSYVINLNRGGFTNTDPQYYLDISITPLLQKITK